WRLSGLAAIVVAAAGAGLALGMVVSGIKTTPGARPEQRPHATLNFVSALATNRVFPSGRYVYGKRVLRSAVGPHERRAEGLHHPASLARKNRTFLCSTLSRLIGSSEYRYVGLVYQLHYVTNVWRYARSRRGYRQACLVGRASRITVRNSNRGLRSLPRIRRFGHQVGSFIRPRVTGPERVPDQT